jgi:hypothetical protein
MAHFKYLKQIDDKIYKPARWRPTEWALLINKIDNIKMKAHGHPKS